MKLQVQDVQVSIKGNDIVKGVTLNASGKEIVGIIGPNGSGKSTLLKAVYRVLKPSSGAVYLDGKAVADMSLRSSAQKMGVMAQQSDFSFDFTVEKMVRIGRTPYKRMMEGDNAEDERLINDAMEMTGTAPLRKRGFSTLSGGEKQRVLIARALAQQTPVLILDEPTNHLDIKYQLQLMEIVKKLDCTVVAAIHDLNIAAMYCDRLYALKDGQIVGEGTPRSLLTAQFLRDLYEVDAHTHVDADGRLHILFLPTAAKA